MLYSFYIYVQRNILKKDADKVCLIFREREIERERENGRENERERSTI